MRGMFRPHLGGLAILVSERIDSGIARINRRIRWNQFHLITSSAKEGASGSLLLRVAGVRPVRRGADPVGVAGVHPGRAGRGIRAASARPGRA